MIKMINYTNNKSTNQQPTTNQPPLPPIRRRHTPLQKTIYPIPFGRITPDIRPRWQPESYWNQQINTLKQQQIKTVPTNISVFQAFGSLTGKSNNWIRERPFTVDCLTTIQWYLNEGWPIYGIALVTNRPQYDIQTITQILNWTTPNLNHQNNWWIVNSYQKIPVRTFKTKNEALQWYKQYIPRNEQKRTTIKHINDLTV